MYDTLISGATIVDGSGNAPYNANVALFGDSIVFIGKEGITRARTQIDGSGLVLAPGFIDIHTHTDLEALRNNRMAVRIAQGITTDVSGNCGRSCLRKISSAGTIRLRTGSISCVVRAAA